MKRKYLLLIVFAIHITVASGSQHDIRFADLPMSLSPNEMVERLVQKGLQRMDNFEKSNYFWLTGRVAGMNADVHINYTRDSMAINYLCLSTHKASNTVMEDYTKLMRWMEKYYGKPNWESTVRSHPFARWYIGFDCDIVLVATAKSNVEVYFYNNHLKRNIDYYAIMKYCERNPVDNVPHLTAREYVTWRSSSAPTAQKKPSKRHHLRKKASKHYSRNGKARKSSRKRRR